MITLMHHACNIYWMTPLISYGEMKYLYKKFSEDQIYKLDK